jgi:eukaryotic-like serine/threonine-protein kinase
MLTIKRFVFSVFTILSIAAFLFCAFYNTQTATAQSPAIQTSIRTYENPTHGITMQYPSDWTPSNTAIPTYNGIVGFYSPLQNLSDVLPAELGLSITTYSQAVSLDEYTKTTLAALEQQGIKVDESSTSTLAGNPSQRITFSPPNPESQNTSINFKVMQTWTVIDNKVYLLSFSADTSKFANYLPIVENMLKSLQIQPL